MRCKALTHKGNRCKREVVNNEFCTFHFGRKKVKQIQCKLCPRILVPSNKTGLCRIHYVDTLRTIEKKVQGK